MLKARLRSDGAECDACIVDISTRGLAVSASAPPARGKYVELVVGKKRLVGQVRWCSQHRFGVALSERVSVMSVIANDDGPVAPPGRTQMGRSAQCVAAAPEGRNRIEFAVFMIIAAVATLTVANFARTTLGSLGAISVALSGEVTE